MAARISVVAYTDFPSDARPRREARALVERGDEVHAYTLGNRGRYRLDGVHVHEVPVPRYRGRRAGSYLASYGQFLAQAAFELARRPRPDVVHVHTLPDFMVFAALGPKLRGARVVLDIHDPMPELYSSKFGLGPFHPLIRAIAAQERAAVRFADHVICTHDLFRTRLIELGVRPDKVSVTLNVADETIFGRPGEVSPSAHPEGAPRLVYHGTVARRLGLDIAVDAFAKLRRDHSALTFQILGRGDYSDTLAQKIRTEGLEDAIDFPNAHLPVEKLPGALSGATIGVVPNRNDPATRLMLPVKLLEYAHMGIPAVAPRLPAIAQYFDEHMVQWYRAGSPDGLAKAVDTLLNDPQRRAHVRAGALRFAERHRWERLRHDFCAAIDGEKAPKPSLRVIQYREQRPQSSSDGR